jgi:hypothetical protein
LFNWIVQEKVKDGKRFESMQVLNLDESFQNKNKQQVGFATSGAGRASRDKLYGLTLMQAMNITGSKTYDKPLIGQISGLMIKNSRIDHSNDAKDDLVIAWLLGFWFLTNGQNVEHYGLRQNELMSEAVFNTANNDVEKTVIYEREVSRRRINDLLNKLHSENNKYIIEAILKTIEKIKNSVDGADEIHLNINNALKEIMLLKKKKEDMEEENYDY